MSKFSLSAIMENLDSRDKDKRFMGLNDLLAELEKASGGGAGAGAGAAGAEAGAGQGVLGLAESDERRLVKKVIELLPDKSSTVQEQAVKAIGPLASRARDHASAEITAALTGHLLYVCDIGSANARKQAAEEMRDIASIGVKNLVVGCAPSQLPTRVVQRLLPALLKGLTDKDLSENHDVVGFVMEGMTDVLVKLAPHPGVLPAADAARVLLAVQPQLSAKRPATRKRAIACLGLLAATVPDALFDDLMAHLISLLTENQNKGDALRTAMQAVTAVSRAVGFRMGKFLDKVVPLLIQAVENDAHEEDDDLREAAFLCFESLLLRCAKDVAPYLDEMVRLGLTFVKHDPNYEDDEEEDEDEEMADGGGDDEEEGDEEEDDDEEWDEEDDEEDYDDDDMSDDDDQSWKVRRSAAKVLCAMVETRRERLLTDVYGSIAPALVRRFGEREENVRLDVYATFAAVLHQTRASSTSDEPATRLAALAPKVTRQLAAQLKSRSASVKARSGVFSLLRELVAVPSAATATAAAMPALVPGLEAALGKDAPKTDANLKIDALAFLRELLTATPDAPAHVATLAKVGPLVCDAAADDYYRVSAEGLKAATALVPVLKAAGGDADEVLGAFSKAVLGKLEVQDTDQEVKDAAITCVGALVSTLGNHAAVAPSMATTLATLRQRLKNEITRLTAVRCVGRIAAATEIGVDVSAQLKSFLSELSGFLRKASRPLRQASLTALHALVAHHCTEGNTDALAKLTGAKEGKHHLLKNLAPLVADSDLQLSHLALRVAAAVVAVSDDTAKAVAGHAATMDGAFALLRSPLLQGVALSSVLDFFAALAGSSAGDRGDATALLKATQDTAAAAAAAAAADASAAAAPASASASAAAAAAAAAAGGGKADGGGASGARIVMGNCAKAIAVVAFAAADDAVRTSTVAEFSKTAGDAANAGAARDVQLALVSLGELGRRSTSGEFGALWDVALKALASAPAEDTKQCASFALGSIAVGDIAQYVPKLLAEVQSQAADAKYLLLHALREVIVGAEEKHAAVLTERQGEILPLLFEHCESEDEGTRTVVAECLGKLALGAPLDVLSQVVSAVGESGGDDDKWRTRATGVTAVKFLVVDQHKLAAAAATTGVSASAMGIDADAVDAALQEHVGVFADLVQDKQLEVRRAALLLLNFAAHHSPHLLRPRLEKLLPLVYAETAVRTELIREVDLGPFKHKVDDGLDSRKAAYEVLYTLLETCPDSVAASPESVAPFVNALVSGVKDVDDIKLLAHLILVRLARVANTALVANGPDLVDSLIDPLRETITTKPKDNAVKQDVDRINELVRTGLKAVAAIESVSGSRDVSAKLDELIKSTILGSDLADRYSDIARENAD